MVSGNECGPSNNSDDARSKLKPTLKSCDITSWFNMGFLGNRNLLLQYVAYLTRSNQFHRQTERVRRLYLILSQMKVPVDKFQSCRRFSIVEAMNHNCIEL